jgi:hypothetical protein
MHQRFLPIIEASAGALTEAHGCPNLPMPDGRMAALRGRAGRGKSGLHGGTVPGNPRRGRPQGKCHRKYTAGPLRHAGRAARVKWCGKSAPRCRQRRRQGKPHREQDQVGAAGDPERSGAPGEPPRRRSGRSHEALGDERPRGMAITAQRFTPGVGQNPAYTPSGARPTVGALADQIGISAVSGGQPCGLPNSLLRVEADRVALLIVWSTRSVSRL